MRKKILDAVETGIEAIQKLKSEEGLAFIEAAVKRIVSCYQEGGKLLLAGNGGSLCDAMHFAEEMTGYFRKERPALPAIAIADPGHLTCVGNDTGFDDVFARGVEALGQPGDIFIGLTTSGNSPNILKATQVAQDKQLGTIAFLGKTGGALKGVCDLEWIVEGFAYSDRIQEAHMTAIHIIIEMVEQELFFSKTKVQQAAGVV